MKIIVDAMGGDNAPLEIVKGAVMASRELGVNIVLTGRTEDVLKALEDMGEKEVPKNIEIANASETVEMEDDPTGVIRKKPDSSMMVGLKMLRDGGGDAFVSAGSTGALLSGATLVVRRIHGIRRAAFAPSIPSGRNVVLLLDSGANVECTPEYLLQFAYMGSFYMRKMMNVEQPRVGLLNIGAEETKGTALQKEAYQLLKKAADEGHIVFVGNVEARDILLGACDVLVTDGFSGNLILKGLEGFGLFALDYLKNLFGASFGTKLAYLLLRKRLRDLKKKVDVSEVGGTALLGISRPVIKAHGSCKAYAIRSAILQAMDAVNANIAAEITANIDSMRIDVPAGEGAEKNG